MREGQALQSLSLVDDSLTAAHAVMVAQELSGLPLELLLLGPSDDHLTMVGAESLAAFWDAPLSFSVRHRFKSSALALIEARNSEANKRGDEEDEAEDNPEVHSLHDLSLFVFEMARCLRFAIVADVTLYLLIIFFL